MMAMGEIPTHRRPRATTSALTLTDEHALLLRQVAIRAEDVLAVIAEDRWPTAELQALIGYLRAEVLCQAGDEEWLLFPAHDAPPGFTRLSRGAPACELSTCWRGRPPNGAHAPQRSSPQPPGPSRTARAPPRIRRGAAGTSGAPDEVPATTTLARRPHEWYPLTEGPVIDLALLPTGQMADAAVDRLVRLHRGEKVELRSSTDPSQVWRRIDGLAATASPTHRTARTSGGFRSSEGRKSPQRTDASHEHWRAAGSARSPSPITRSWLRAVRAGWLAQASGSGCSVRAVRLSSGSARPRQLD